MSSLKRLGLSVLLIGGLMVTAGAGTASAAFDPTGPFNFEAGETRLTINGTSNYVQCSDSRALGDADGSNPLNVALTFGGTCVTQANTSASVTCADPTGTLTGSNFTSTTADVAVELTGSCSIVIGSNLCTITAPSAGSLPWAVPGTGSFVEATGGSPATLTIPAPSTVPFTSSGSFCGLIGVPSSGQSTFAPPAGGSTLVYTQDTTTGDNPVTVSP